ncbi:hypothetical protein EVAR_13492_1 [Eumeta japonica]|uniref:Uncharacterized protein n=1 Tax=Eumeta variegata TaxID=151549 RepID=A0A4C1UZI6_EUMVA|nr:hypothetical protein EVAR_13492_1 [Eumeta japonica]
MAAAANKNDSTYNSTLNCWIYKQERSRFELGHRAGRRRCNHMDDIKLEFECGAEELSRWQAACTSCRWWCYRGHHPPQSQIPLSS